MIKRVFLIVLDSFGIGEMPDSNLYGDEGSNTLAAVADNPNFNCPNLTKLGLFNIDGIGEMLSKRAVAKPLAARFGKAEIGTVTNLFAAAVCILLFFLRHSNVF